VIHSLVFGFGFKARHGKDTAVAAILEARGNEYDMHRYAMADELKREVNDAAITAGGMKELFNKLPFPAEWAKYDPNPDMSDPFCPMGKQRHLLQIWGSEYRRAQNKDYWVTKVAEKIAYDKPEIALLSDVRFINEVNFCKEYGEVIKVCRPDEPTLSGHISEEELESYTGWSATLVNDGTLADLKHNAVNCFDDLMEKVHYPLESLWGV
jgi:hypothetical protein